MTFTALSVGLPIENNNQAWELIDNSPDSLHAGELLSRAYASHRHWFEIGGPLEKQRAEHLVATAVSFLGIVSLSVHHADACIKLSDANGDRQTRFDRRRLWSAWHGRTRARDWRTQQTGGKRLGRRGTDRGRGRTATFERLLSSGPWFGLD